MPIRRAVQRDEHALERWRADVWPGLFNQAYQQRRVLVFEDEAGFYRLSGVVRTVASRARTPVLREKQTRNHRSDMGGMTPEGKVDTLVKRTSLNGRHCIEFLNHLRAVTGQRLLVIWDGSPIHRRGAAAVDRDHSYRGFNNEEQNHGQVQGVRFRRTFRCSGCGFLESYARPEFGAQ
jgi:hypothetical protein